MQIVSSVTFEELLTTINIEDGGSWREKGAGFLYLVMLKEKKYILQAKWDVSFVGAETVK